MADRWWIQVFVRGEEYPDEAYSLHQAKKQALDKLEELGLNGEGLEWHDAPGACRGELGPDGEVVLTRINEETDHGG